MNAPINTWTALGRWEDSFSRKSQSGCGSKIPGTQKVPIGKRKSRPSYLWSPLGFSFWPIAKVVGDVSISFSTEVAVISSMWICRQAVAGTNGRRVKKKKKTKESRILLRYTVCTLVENTLLHTFYSFYRVFSSQILKQTCLNPSPDGAKETGVHLDLVLATGADMTPSGNLIAVRHRGNDWES